MSSAASPSDTPSTPDTPVSESTSALETATLGGGCFWCLEAVYRQVRGVHEVRSGYAGGFVPEPSYRQVCTGSTGHAEVVQVRFDPSVVTYGELLGVFFGIHDPTTLNRQGADIGTQYRSVILTHGDEQEALAQQMIQQLRAEGVYDDPIVTEVEPAAEFWPAEPEHERYFERHPDQAYCSAVVAPKVAGFRRKFAHLIEQPA